MGLDVAVEEGEAGHQHPDRLKLAEKIGAVAIDDSTGDAVEKVLASFCRETGENVNRRPKYCIDRVSLFQLYR